MEEEITTAETEQGDVANNEGESTVEISNDSPAKRGRGRPPGSKNVKSGVEDVNPTEPVSDISNGGSTQPPRKRGRPKLKKTTEQEGSGDDHADNSVQTAESEDSPTANNSPKKRGAPRKSLSKSTSEEADVQDGGSDAPKAKRGRPKGSTKRKLETLTSAENEGSLITRRQQRSSVNKKPRLEGTNGNPTSLIRKRGRPRKVESSQVASNGISKRPRRGKGRPRKGIVLKSGDEKGGSQPAKRGRGRPKGSLNKKPPAYKVHSKVGRPKKSLPTKGSRGRPRKQPAPRGRPRKYPLPSPEELKKPKVWKPLGRPRKYPRVDPPEGSPPAPRRSRGRPCKAESKKGAHLRKSLPASSSHSSDAGPQRKRGRPPSASKSNTGTPAKRGRPKGSLNKNKARSEAQLDSALPNHSSTDGVEPVEAEVEDNAAATVEEHEAEMPVDHDTETSVKKDTEHEDNTEESLNAQDASFEVSNQA